jgi:hypothetical protein
MRKYTRHHALEINGVFSVLLRDCGTIQKKIELFHLMGSSPISDLFLKRYGPPYQ